MASVREQVIQDGFDYFDTGKFVADLSKNIAMETESQVPEKHAAMLVYYTEILIPAFHEMGFQCQILDNPVRESLPFLFAERMENKDFTTVLGYGHVDVVTGMDGKWDQGRSPWKIETTDNLIYGRGTADNKGQHAINLAALKIVLKQKGSLGFNAKYLIESAEEVGSPGLYEICERHKDLLMADLLIASDGPRQQAEKPTVYLGSRGSRSFDLVVDLRQGSHHSGNWGGVIPDPGTILAQAIACIADKDGVIAVPEWRPDGIPDDVRAVLSEVVFDQDAGEEPQVDPKWGEPGLTAAEKLFAWSSFAVLAFETGNPAKPVGAIPPRAWARCGLRFPPGLDMKHWQENLRTHLDKAGFEQVEIISAKKSQLDATRTELHNPWVILACRSLQKTTGRKPVLLPNLAGSLPNGCFTDVLGIPTVWVPHSYPGCSQHAPNEHLLASVAREALGIMAGLYWDIGEVGKRELL